jgi:hypothetical protein
MQPTDTTNIAIRRLRTTLYCGPVVLLTFLLASVGIYAQQSRAADALPEQAEPVALTVETKVPFTFVAYGDLREAHSANSKATDPVRSQDILDAIAAAKPAFVEVGGDLVVRGDDEGNWQQWEDQTAGLRRGGIPIFPAIGNHELMGDSSKGLEYYFQHFPVLRHNRYYSVRAGNTITFVLDSALDETDGPQGTWLQQQLQDIAPDIDFVFVLIHHPPYTHSQGGPHGGGHSARAKEIALANWLEARQSSMRAKIIVIAGHVHNYERYSHGGVVYIVSGGGGATPYEIPREPGDAYRQPGSTYNYCLIQVSSERLMLEMKRLDVIDGKARWSTGDSLTLSVLPRPTEQKTGTGPISR